MSMLSVFSNECESVFSNECESVCSNPDSHFVIENVKGNEIFKVTAMKVKKHQL